MSKFLEAYLEGRRKVAGVLMGQSKGVTAGKGPGLTAEPIAGGRPKARSGLIEANPRSVADSRKEPLRVPRGGTVTKRFAPSQLMPYKAGPGVAKDDPMGLDHNLAQASAYQDTLPDKFLRLDHSRVKKVLPFRYNDSTRIMAGGVGLYNPVSGIADVATDRPDLGGRFPADTERHEGNHAWQIKGPIHGIKAYLTGPDRGGEAIDSAMLAAAKEDGFSPEGAASYAAWQRQPPEVMQDMSAVQQDYAERFGSRITDPGKARGLMLALMTGGDEDLDEIIKMGESIGVTGEDYWWGMNAKVSLPFWNYRALNGSLTGFRAEGPAKLKEFIDHYGKWMPAFVDGSGTGQRPRLQDFRAGQLPA